MESNKVYIIIPAFNESEVIQKVISGLLTYKYNIVVVDDGSTIATRSNLEGVSGIHIIRHKVNLGQGAAIQTGIRYALMKGASFIVTFDGDGQHSPDDIPVLLSVLQKDEADISLASRFLRKGSHNASFIKKGVLKAGRWVNYFFTGLYLSDSHNGLRAMNRLAAEKIELKENRMAHATEILLAIRKFKLRYREMPATVSYTAYSKQKGQSVLNSVRIFFDLVLHKLFE